MQINKIVNLILMINQSGLQLQNQTFNIETLFEQLIEEIN